MSFEDPSLVFISTGIILFTAILAIKHAHLLYCLLLATASILWAILAFKHWATMVPVEFGWTSIFLPILGIVSAVNILMKTKTQNHGND